MGSGVFAQGRSIVARLEHGADLLDEIVALAERHGIEAGGGGGGGGGGPARPRPDPPPPG